MATGLGPFVDLMRLTKQGPWTNNPSDPNYAKHWNMEDLRPDEVVTKVYTGRMGSRLKGGMVNVRVAEGPAGRMVYVDKPKITRVGPVAKALGRAADELGTFTPLRLADPVIQMNAPQNRVRISTDRGTIDARTDSHIGRSGDLAPGEQIKQMWRFLRG
jgi:hypothetical protein